MKKLSENDTQSLHTTPNTNNVIPEQLAIKAGKCLEAISEALIHSDTGTTHRFINTSNVVPMAVGEFALQSLKN